MIISLIVNSHHPLRKFSLIFTSFCVPWLEFYLSDDPILGNFWEELYIFCWLKKGTKDLNFFRIKKHGHISFQIIISLFSKRLTLKQDSTPPNTCHFSFFHFFSSFSYKFLFTLLSFLLLRLPSQVFNLADFHYLTASGAWRLTKRNLTFSVWYSWFVILGDGESYWDKSFYFGILEIRRSQRISNNMHANISLKIVNFCPLFSNDSARQSVPAYQFSSYELRYYFTCNIGIRGGFHPLGKIVDATRMKRCPFNAFGSIAPMISIPYIEKGHGVVKTFKVIGESLALSAYNRHLWHFLTCTQQSFSMVNQK